MLARRAAVQALRTRGKAGPISRSSSAAASNNDGPAPPEAQPSNPPHNIYMWGTSKQGTVPLSLLKGGAASSGGMFSGDASIVDHPMRLELEEGGLQTFLFGEDKDGDGDARLEKVFCGASGTAMVLDDGRCFVAGSNKNGQLGIGSDQKQATSPIHLPLPSPVAKASLGPNFSALLTTTGDLYTFGYGGSRIHGMG
ncbi:hypothetical protein ACHAXT_003818 [Thalassiosira profunda]